MHKKSLEAADTLKENPELMCSQEEYERAEAHAQAQASTDSKALDQDDIRSVSIAALRAKAQSYREHLQESLQSSASLRQRAELCSSFDTPSSNENDDSDTLLDPTD